MRFRRRALLALAGLSFLTATGLAGPAHALPSAPSSCTIVTFVDEDHGFVMDCNGRASVGNTVEIFVGRAWTRIRNFINPRYDEQRREEISRQPGMGGTRD